MNRNRFIGGEDNDFDAAIIEGIGQFNQIMPILDLLKQRFYLHVMPSTRSGEKVSCGDQSEGIEVFEQGFGPVGVVQELDGRKEDADLAAEQWIAEPVWLPVHSGDGFHGHRPRGDSQ